MDTSISILELQREVKRLTREGGDTREHVAGLIRVVDTLNRENAALKDRVLALERGRGQGSGEAGPPPPKI